MTKGTDGCCCEETSGEVRIMAALAEMREQLNAVRVIATGRRAEDGDLLDVHDAEIAALKEQTAGHAKELLDLHVQMSRVIRELTVGNLTGERNEKKLDKVLTLLEAKK